jgi:flagellar biosynthesis protein FlhG
VPENLYVATKRFLIKSAFCIPRDGSPFVPQDDDVPALLSALSARARRPNCMRFTLDKSFRIRQKDLRRLLARNGSRVLAVTGGSTSVGCTTTVVNLAAALVEQGKDVLVIDECLGDYSVGAARRRTGGRQLRRRGTRRDIARRRRGASCTGLFSAGRASRSNREGYTAAQLGMVLDGPADIVLIDAQLDRLGQLSALAMQAHDLLIVTRVAGRRSPRRMPA